MRIDPTALTDWVTEVFRTAGLDAKGAQITAQALVQADMQGTSSHGLMMLPLYVDRIRAGSVSTTGKALTLRDSGICVVLDGQNMMGHISARQAVDLLLERTPEHGVVAVSIANGFHLGAAGYWTQMLAEKKLIGILMSNTRPLMPPPGGAEAVVGNNPLAVSIPVSGGTPICLDMAMSAGAMGKIRMAANTGQPIPAGWATDAGGNPTTDPESAISGMLLPTGGAKGFGLAVIIDLLCGGLSGGGMGAEITSLFGDKTVSYNCAHLFMGIDPAHFGDPDQFCARAQAYADVIRASRPLDPAVSPPAMPGDGKQAALATNAQGCPMAEKTYESLLTTARALGVDTPPPAPQN